eukprot:TRINITY_DN2596_c0_g1_i3.p1 TRINITY_DN2596_c0_g1~~TRINITY_DN2596_c0_g1_i3.p1  ORF type:complete len:122 (-),score=15.14 TRINITY_DN2596_c0_g1_i3:382-747(-)
MDGEGDLDSEPEARAVIGSYQSPVRVVNDSAEEILLLWSIQQPTLTKHNSFVRHSSLRLDLEACGRRLTIFQSPSSMVSFPRLVNSFSSNFKEIRFQPRSRKSFYDNDCGHKWKKHISTEN